VAYSSHRPRRTNKARWAGDWSDCDERGKPKKLALVAAARKLLAWAWAVFSSGQPFDATKTVKLAP
jgi:hypothetical protein